MLSLIVPSLNWMAKLASNIGAFIAGLGGLGVMILAIGDSSFLSIPEGNDLLIVVLSTGKSWGNMAYYVAMTIIGSIIGCFLLYSVGRKGGSPLLRMKLSPQSIERAERLFEKYGLLTVLIPSILPPPMPFKIFVLSAGVFRLKAFEFLLAIFIGRTIRYSLWGILAVIYGNSVKLYMQHNLKLVGIFLFGLFALVVAVAIVYYMHRMRTRKSGKVG
jgi:membrane protein DedA with SNARE-associated domain